MNADTFALRALLETQAARKKQGSAADRAALATAVREQRTRHTNGLVQGNFTRKQWNAQLSEYIWNNLARMTRARRLHVAKGEK
jgi:ribosomal protein S8E